MQDQNNINYHLIELWALSRKTSPFTLGEKKLNLALWFAMLGGIFAIVLILIQWVSEEGFDFQHIRGTHSFPNLSTPLVSQFFHSRPSSTRSLPTGSRSGKGSASLQADSYCNVSFLPDQTRPDWPHSLHLASSHSQQRNYRGTQRGTTTAHIVIMKPFLHRLLYAFSSEHLKNTKDVYFGALLSCKG